MLKISARKNAEFAQIVNLWNLNIAFLTFCRHSSLRLAPFHQTVAPIWFLFSLFFRVSVDFGRVKKKQRLSLSNSTMVSRSTHFRWFLCGKSNLGAQWERPRLTPMPNWINNYQKEVEWACTRSEGGHTNQGVRPLHTPLRFRLRWDLVFDFLEN